MSEHVLIVCNREPDLGARRRFLESSGFRVVTAATLQDAINTLHSRRIDAVVVDGSALTGNHDLAAMKQRNPRTPLILLDEHDSLPEDLATLVDAAVAKAQESTFLASHLKPLIKVRSHSHAQLQEKYVVFADASRRYLDCSDAVCELLSYSRTEMLGMTIDEVSYRPEKTSTLFDQYVKKGALDGQFILKHKTGKPVFIHYRSHVFSDGCMAAVWEPIEDWKQLYQAAMLEFDRSRMAERVDLAHAAVEQRIQELSGDKAQHAREWQQLNDALTGLRILKREIAS